MPTKRAAKTSDARLMPLEVPWLMTLPEAIRLALAVLADAALAAVSADERETYQAAYDCIAAGLPPDSAGQPPQGP